MLVPEDLHLRKVQTGFGATLAMYPNQLINALVPKPLIFKMAIPIMEFYQS